MASYNLNLTLQSIWTVLRMVLDIFIIWLVIFYAIKLVKKNERTIQIFKGIILVIGVDLVAKMIGLSTVAFLADMFVNWGILAIIIVFQPEVRSLLENLGKTNLFSRIATLSGNEKEKLVDEVVKAVDQLSKTQTGALICLEQSQSMNDYIKTGTPINSVVTAELLTSLFITTTPLHDGAVIIQGDRLACASAYFPPTNSSDVPSRYGSRHRAAIGISEVTDSITICVSEETGSVSVADQGKLTGMNRSQLHRFLMQIICNIESDEDEYKRNKNNIVLQENQQITVENPKLKVVQEEDTEQRRGLFGKLSLKRQQVTEEVVTEEDRLQQLEREEANMKLPKRKKRKAEKDPRFTQEPMPMQEFHEETDDVAFDQAPTQKQAELNAESSSTELLHEADDETSEVDTTEATFEQPQVKEKTTEFRVEEISQELEQLLAEENENLNEIHEAHPIYHHETVMNQEMTEPSEPEKETEFLEEMIEPEEVVYESNADNHRTTDDTMQDFKPLHAALLSAAAQQVQQEQEKEEQVVKFLDEEEEAALHGEAELAESQGQEETGKDNTTNLEPEVRENLLEEKEPAFIAPDLSALDQTNTLLDDFIIPEEPEYTRTQKISMSDILEAMKKEDAKDAEEFKRRESMEHQPAEWVEHPSEKMMNHNSQADLMDALMKKRREAVSEILEIHPASQDDLKGGNNE